MSDSLLINCWRLISLSTLSLSVFDIALLHKSAGLMLVDTGMSPYIIWVGDGVVELKLNQWFLLHKGL